MPAAVIARTKAVLGLTTAGAPLYNPRMNLRTRSSLVIAGAALVVLALLVYLLILRPAPHPQFVVLIIMDAVRPDHLGCYGYGRDTSPRIDNLAGRGVIFDDAITQASWTLPSVATMLTSTFPCQLFTESGFSIVPLPAPPS